MNQLLEDPGRATSYRTESQFRTVQATCEEAVDSQMLLNQDLITLADQRNSYYQFYRNAAKSRSRRQVK
jgi:hypothetical protein